MTRSNKVLAYATGFLLGLLVLSLIPREKEQPRRHPWHAQTAPEGTYPMVLQDDLGRSVRLEKQPRHFISLAPSVTELLFAMDMGDHLMAVTRWCDFPEEARKLRDAGAQVGAMDQPDRELIATYAPDLIIGTDLTPPEVYATLEKPPRTMALVLRQESMEDVIGDIALIGKAAGVPGKAVNLIGRLKAHQASVRERLSPFLGLPERRVLFLLSIEANAMPGWSPGKNTWVNDLLEQSHAVNLAAGMGLSWGEISPEALVSLNPEVVLVRDADTVAGKSLLRERLGELPQHPVWSKVSAVREGRVHILPHGPLNIPGPRIMEAYEAVAGSVWELQEGQTP